MNSTLPFKAAAALGSAFFLTACGEQGESEAEKPVAAPVSENADADVALESVDQQVSYGVGYNVGANVAAEGNLEADFDAIVAGLRDGLAQADARLDQQTLQAAFMSLQERAAAANLAAAEGNLTEAESWLEENAGRAEVTVTESGLQYEVLESAAEDAPSPTPEDTVEVHYHGTLTDGTVFDSSIERGESISFPVSQVIDGWTEALQLMSIGDRWKLYIPPELGYGPGGAGEIPPNAVLIFEVELIGIE